MSLGPFVKLTVVVAGKVRHVSTARIPRPRGTFRWYDERANFGEDRRDTATSLTRCQQTGRLTVMAEITMREIENADYVQHAELRIPIELLPFRTSAARDQRDIILNALAFIADVKKLAFDHLGVDDDNADYTSFEYKGLDGDVLVVEVAQVNV